LSRISTCCCSHRVEHPARLVRLQKKHWDPLIRWMKDEFDITMATTTAITPPEHPAETPAKVFELLESFDKWEFSALDSVTASTKSLVVGLAVLKNRLTIDEAYAAARVEEQYQIDEWGKVHGPFGHSVDMITPRVKIAAARNFMNLLAK
jgi:ATP synthase mitochondrial F1 complex assembly factor 2